MTDIEGDAVSGVVEVVGALAARVVGAGSKSEMTAVVLLADEAPDDPGVVLRRRDAVALDAEPELLALVGSRVRVTGTRTWTTLVVDSVEVLDPPAGPVLAADDL